MTQQALLLAAVVAVGVLHTLVPDHWVPIALLARSRGWTHARTAQAAFFAGLGHTISTLAIGVLVWAVGLAFAARFGHFVSLASSLALIAFGGWIAVAAWREAREPPLEAPADGVAEAASERPNARIALLLILGSSPMVEGIPAFFAAAKFGWQLIVVMSLLFALSTIVTYVTLCVSSSATLKRMSFGPLERYGEVLSGAAIALVGVAFLVWPVG